MWSIVLILLIVSIVALLWWRNRQERQWQQELTYLTRYEGKVVANSMQTLAQAQAEQVDQQLNEQDSQHYSDAHPLRSESSDQEQQQNEQKMVDNSVLVMPKVPEQDVITPQITIIESGPKPEGSDQLVPQLPDSDLLTHIENEQQDENNEQHFQINTTHHIPSDQTSLVANSTEEEIAGKQPDDETGAILSEAEEMSAAESVENDSVKAEQTDNKLEVISLEEATRKVVAHTLVETSQTHDTTPLEIIKLNWQYKPVRGQQDQPKHKVREITADDPVLNRVRTRTRAEQEALLKARALKNFNLEELEQATQHALGHTVATPSHLAHTPSRHRHMTEPNNVHVIDEEDIRLNLLRQRLARHRHKDQSHSLHSPYTVPVIPEEEVFANLAKTDSPVNKQRFQRPVVRESVIPAAARIGKRHAMRMTAPVADMSVEKVASETVAGVNSPLSTRFTPFHTIPSSVETSSILVENTDSRDEELLTDSGNAASGGKKNWKFQLTNPYMMVQSTQKSAWSETTTENDCFKNTETTFSENDQLDNNVTTAIDAPYFIGSENDYEPLWLKQDVAAENLYTQADSLNDSADVPMPTEWSTTVQGEVKEDSYIFNRDETETTKASDIHVVNNFGSMSEVKSRSFVTDLHKYPSSKPTNNINTIEPKTAIGMALERALHKPSSVQTNPVPIQLKPILPGMELLLPPHFDPAVQQTEETLLENGITIEEKLAEFKVKVRVIDAFAGPVITRYEIEPAQGVRGSQVVNLEKDLARSLGFASIRIVETIPGKTCMGLELPNPKRQIIRLSEIFSAPEFQQSHSKLTLALGQGITGQPVVTDLAKAPHLLVAGTTGSGKSVGVNAMILSMLFKATPEDVRLIMIDPKMLELSIYEGIPHLLAPVVTDMKLAANALTWCVNEMEKRYRLMSHAGVRNLAGFNQKIADMAVRGKKLANPFSLTPDDPEPLEKLPFIVVVVDEFADLMMTAGKKIEELIARLAQKARAAGIHLILATQRPSVDVITGLIKANIPTRIAFQVSSKIDSRTILDQMGAENLLGQGDMLFLPPGTAYPERVHGAFVADEEVHRVVKYLKQFGEPQYIDDILTAGVGDDDLFSNAPSRNSDDDQDPLYDDAVALVVRTRKASISSVQRQLRIGYNRAARLVEQMESDGVVSAPEGNGNRTVLAPQNNHLDG